jgi:hypothetical protein
MTTARNHHIMRRTRPLALFALAPLALALLGSTGCASFKLKDKPPGYIEVSDYVGYKGAADLRMKAPDNVGLSIKTFDNYEGGSLSLWSEDLVKKLGSRGYVLTGQKPVTSKNGVAGTRFDFRYTPHGADEEKYYVAILFVTDDWRVVAQFAGTAELAEAHEKDITALLSELKVKGCKLGEDTCKGPQPSQLSTPPENLEKLEAKRKEKAAKAAEEGKPAEAPAEVKPAEDKPAEGQPPP